MDGVTLLQWNKFECDLCKTKYPFRLNQRGHQLELIEYEKPEGSYMVLETLDNEKDALRMIYINEMGEERTEVKIGRGHDA